MRYQFEKNQDYPISSAPWWAEQIKNSEYVQVGDVDALPDEIEPAFKINLSAEQLADSVLLAQVHDLGKVGVPDQYF